MVKNIKCNYVGSKETGVTRPEFKRRANTIPVLLAPNQTWSNASIASTAAGQQMVSNTREHTIHSLFLSLVGYYSVQLQAFDQKN